MGNVDLVELAARISDGERIDWNGYDGMPLSAEERRLVGNLRLLESLKVSSAGVSAPGQPPPALTAIVRSSLNDLPVGASDAALSGAPEPPTSWGGLQIRERVGRGAFGEVYRAWDPNLDREVALKLVTHGAAGTASTVLKEGKILARVVHPHVVTVHGAEIHDGVVGLWMEFVQGSSLESLLEEQGPFGPREAALIGLDLCRALGAVHEAGLIHRDIKAHNVMRGAGGRLVLMDFGAAHDVMLDGEGSVSIAGTPLYIAPEVFAGRHADVRSDIYSVGVLLHHLVTRSYPVEAGSIPDLRKLHERGESRLLRDARPDLPDAFVHAVQRALAPDPDARYRTAGEMAEGLSVCLGIETPSERPGPSRRGPGRAAWFVGGILAIALLLLAVRYSDRIFSPPPAGTDHVTSDAVAERTEAGDAGGRPEPVPPAEPPTSNRAPVAEETFVEDRSTAPAREIDVPDPAPGIQPGAADYTIQVALYRLDARERQERLDSGARLALRDRLWLEFTTSRSVYVYVINRDDEGRGFALFPLPELELKNPIPSDRRVRIPGRRDGTEQWWAVDTPGGREDILILVSPERQVEFEEQMASLALPGQPAVVLGDLAETPVRGIGALAGPTDDTPAESAARLFAMAEELAGRRAEVARGVWFKKFELVNPK